MIKAN